MIAPTYLPALQDLPVIQYSNHRKDPARVLQHYAANSLMQKFHQRTFVQMCPAVPFLMKKTEKPPGQIMLSTFQGQVY
jgi:hypothetical protein